MAGHIIHRVTSYTWPAIHISKDLPEQINNYTRRVARKQEITILFLCKIGATGEIRRGSIILVSARLSMLL